MAFQSLMSGSECSTSANPLSQLLKQQQTDRSLHQGPSLQSSGPLPGTLRTHSPMQGGGQEAEQFFAGGQMGNGGAVKGGELMGMGGLRRELDGLTRGQQQHPGQDWSGQFAPGPAPRAQLDRQFDHAQSQSQPNQLSAEFWRQQQHLAQNATHSGFATPTPQSQSSSAYQQTPQASYAQQSYSSYSQMGMGTGMGMGNLGMRMQPQFMSTQQQPVTTTSAKGKGKLVELDEADWEAQFARAGESATKVEEPNQVEAQTIPSTLLEDSIELEANEADAALLKELESTWANLQDNLKQGSLSDNELAQWEAQYGSQFASQHFDEGEDAMDLPGLPQIWTKDNVDAFLKEQNEFPFQEDNNYLNMADPFAEGHRLLREGAPLSEAALAFEAACRQDPTRAEAWKAAGETWAADEREVKGITALERAVACGGPDGVGAWMSLAVAYVNEGQEMRALATLEKWQSLAYPQLSAPAGSEQRTNPWETSQRVIDLFISAAQAGPSARVKGQSTELNDVVDPDVQVGLGVLFYSNSDYDKARDCFEAALSARPTDFLLWNRLGATLANGGQPEAAISAYRKALELRPTFTRATYNLGVSCLNIGCYQEAAEHLLAALEGQRTGEEGGEVFDGAADDGSANLWHTLRRAFLCMERHDLAEKSHPGTSLDEFRQQGFEF